MSWSHSHDTQVTTLQESSFFEISEWLFGHFDFFVYFCTRKGKSWRDSQRKPGKPTITHMNMTRQKIIKIIISVLIAALTALGAALGLQSCNVVRTITNKSEFYQRGDTNCLITTKTIESYEATRR